MICSRSGKFYIFITINAMYICIHFNVNFIDLQSNVTFCFSLDPDAAISINASTSATISWMSPSKLAWKRLQSFLALRSSSSTFFTLKMNTKFTIHVLYILYILQMWKNFPYESFSQRYVPVVSSTIKILICECQKHTKYIF